MKKMISFASMIVCLALPNLMNAQEATTAPAISQEEYSQKITQRLAHHLNLSAFQQSQIQEIVMKYGSIPAGNNIYQVNGNCEHEIVEVLTDDQALSYKHNYNKIWSGEPETVPSVKPEPKSKDKKHSVPVNK